MRELESLRAEAKREREKGEARPAKRAKGDKLSERDPW